jgi:hypothetical protein
MIESAKLQKRQSGTALAVVTSGHFLCGLCSGAGFFFIGGCMKKEFIPKLIDCGSTNKKGCWLVTNCELSPNGYPRKWIRDGSKNGRNKTVSRLVWEWCFGIIPKGKFVLHTCDTRNCIRPSHLFLGNHKDNMRDMFDKNRHPHGSTHGCSKLTEEQIPSIRSDTRTIKEISKEYGVSAASINNVKLRRIWRHVPGGEIRTPINHLHKLTKEQVITIRNDTRASAIIGKEYGVASSVVRRIIRREIWKCIP